MSGTRNSTENEPYEQSLGTTLKYVLSSLGFFTPYRSFSDFAKTLFVPIYKPFLLAAATAIAVVVCIGSLLFAASMALLEQKWIATPSVVLSFIACCLTPILGAAALLSGALTILAVPFELAKLLTRTGASVVNAISSLAEEKGINAPTQLLAAS